MRPRNLKISEFQPCEGPRLERLLPLLDKPNLCRGLPV
jgi:hypothetical protein